MMETFTNFITKGFSAEEVDGRRIIKGHITVEVVDRQNEFIAISEVLDVMKTYMENPQISDWHSNRMVGKLLNYEKSEVEGHPSIFAEVEIRKSEQFKLYDEVWEKIKKGEYQGFSLGGASKFREDSVQNGKLVTSLKGLELYEIAVCPSPINQLSVFTDINQFAKAGMEIQNNEGRERIQCTSVLCEFGKAEEQIEDELFKAKLEKYVKSTIATEFGKVQDEIKKAEKQQILDKLVKDATALNE
jgi:hypothetical protein